MVDFPQPEALVERIEELVESLDVGPESGLREKSRALLSSVLELHRLALLRIQDHLRETGAGETLNVLAKDPLVGNVLLLHDLHPQDLRARIEEALEEVRPTLASHRGNVEVVSLEREGDSEVVRLRMTGTCKGCPSSVSTFRNLIETSVAAHAPEIGRIELVPEGKL